MKVGASKKLNFYQFLLETAENVFYAPMWENQVLLRYAQFYRSQLDGEEKAENSEFTN